MEKDLKAGEVYFSKSILKQYDSLLGYVGNNRFSARLYIQDEYEGRNRFDIAEWIYDPNRCEDYTIATEEQKKWYRACEKAGKFIPLEEAFPEYYEYVGSETRNFTVGRIYKIFDRYNINRANNFTDNCGKLNGFAGVNEREFKPSTKEAYEKQRPYEGTVIHCKDQAELDCVISRCEKDSLIRNSKNSFKQYIREFPEGVAVSIERNSYGGLDYFHKNHFDIISFEDWFSKKPQEEEEGVELTSTSMNLEVGKWYKSDSSCKHIQAIKFKDLEVRSGAQNVIVTRFDGAIVNEIYRNGSEYNGGCIYNNDFFNSLREVPIEDIQEFLPGDHPDKIKSLIKKEETMTKQREFKVGDKCVVEYTVAEIFEKDRYPIHCRDGNDEFITFTREGIVYLNGKNTPILKHIEDITPKPEFPKWMIVETAYGYKKRFVIYKDESGFAYVEKGGSYINKGITWTNSAKEIEPEENKEEVKRAFNGVSNTIKIKLPIVLCPREIWDKNKNKERLEEVKEAIKRYYNDGFTIDPKWIEEYNELVKEMKSE